jgi:Papain family cysteine protease
MARPRRVKRILNVEPSPRQEEDWTFEQATGAGVAEAAPPIPPRKDLREAWWKVGDQGSTGSCVGWATADGVLRWHFVKAGRLADTERLSPRFHWMAAKETDQFVNRPTTFIEGQGTSVKAALDIARKFGSVRDRLLPFASGNLYGGDEKTFYAIAAKLKIASYYNLGRDLAVWRNWLATRGPILTRLDVDDTWYAARENKGNLDSYDADSKRGGHAVSLVGYTPQRFIVRNSWGTSTWGDAGFGYASLGYAQAAFTEAYGIAL